MKRLLLIWFMLISFVEFSQYCGTATTNVTITPTTTVQYTNAYAAGRRAFNFYAEAGSEYTFSTVGQTTVDTYLRLYSTATGGSILAWSDDYFNTQSEITWYCTTSGNYSVFLTRWSSSSTCSNINASAKIKYQKGSTAGSTIVSIGNGEGVIYNAPANHYYNYGWSEMIYLQSEINTTGNITKIRFQVDPTSTIPYTATNQKVYMAHTTLATFPSTSVKEDAQTNYTASNYTLVYDGTVTWSIGWVEIALQTPFPWNNTNNLLIKWENRHGNYTFNEPWFYYTTQTNTVGYYHRDASYPTINGTRSSLRPNIKLALSDVALPVELSTFNGTIQEKNNYLFWVTSSEQNTSHFNLQKSRDGETWTTITTLNAAGNSTNQIDYNVTDYKVEPIINYYRLQQYDLNGVYETFGPIAIDNTNLKTTKVVVKYINLRGQEIDPSQFTSTEVYIEVYDDGTMKRVYR